MSDGLRAWVAEVRLEVLVGGEGGGVEGGEVSGGEMGRWPVEGRYECGLT